MQKTVPYLRILQVLTDLVDNQRSGTLFIRSDDNHALTLALDTGRIYAIYHGTRCGRKAIPLISKVSGGTYTFKTSGLSGISHDLPTTPEILNLLRTPHSSKEVRPAWTKAGGPADEISEEDKNLLCQKLKSLLAEHLGPISEMIFENAQEEIGDFFSSPELAIVLVDKLSVDINDTHELAQFRAKAYVAINNILEI